MVKRKPKANKDEAAETVIDAEIISPAPSHRFSRAEIISGFAAILSVIAVGLALWPVFTSKIATQRQAELSQKVETLQVALETLAAAQTELAQSVVAQQGLSGALKTDIDRLATQANNLSENLRIELESLAINLQKNQQDWLDNLALPSAPITDAPSPKSSSPETSSPASPPEVSSEVSSELANKTDSDTGWLPKWADASLDNIADWLSSLIEIRKAEDEPIAEGGEANNQSPPNESTVQ